MASAPHTDACRYRGRHETNAPASTHRTAREGHIAASVSDPPGMVHGGGCEWLPEGFPHRMRTLGRKKIWRAPALTRKRTIYQMLPTDRFRCRRAVRTVQSEVSSVSNSESARSNSASAVFTVSGFVRSTPAIFSSSSG